LHNLRQQCVLPDHLEFLSSCTQWKMESKFAVVVATVHMAKSVQQGSDVHNRLPASVVAAAGSDAGSAAAVVVRTAT